MGVSDVEKGITCKERERERENVCLKRFWLKCVCVGFCCENDYIMWQSNLKCQVGKHKCRKKKEKIINRRMKLR